MDFEVNKNGARLNAPGAQLRSCANKWANLTDDAILREGEKAIASYLKSVTEKVATGRKGKGVDRLRATEIRQSVDEVQGVVTLTPGMQLQEFGGTLRVRNKRYLAIPLPAAMRGGRPIKLRARQWAKTRVIESRKGNLVIAQRRGREWVPLYALKKEAVYKARLGLDRELNRQRPALLADIARRLNRLTRLD